MTYYLSFFFFLYIASILWVTRNPPKIFTAAKIMAKNPKIFAVSKMFPEFPAKAAIIAPTILQKKLHWLPT